MHARTGGRDASASATIDCRTNEAMLERPHESSGLVGLGQQPRPRSQPRSKSASTPASKLVAPPRRFDIGRMNDNELILFAEAERESWIIYPPRSLYAHVRRPTSDSTVVEHRSWQPFSEPVEHVVRAAEGCAEHGLDCGALSAITAATEAGWNPFK
jgi:hypothetical protein